MNFKIEFLGSTLKDKWECNQWRVTLNKQRFDYFTGLGIYTEPCADAILDSLFLDSEAETMSFSDFCSNYGYEHDSRKVEQLYKACKRNAEKLRKALGDEYQAEKERISAIEF